MACSGSGRVVARAERWVREAVSAAEVFRALPDLAVLRDVPVDDFAVGLADGLGDTVTIFSAT
jgi:hypothetical protein